MKLITDNTQSYVVTDEYFENKFDSQLKNYLDEDYVVEDITDLVKIKSEIDFSVY